jgi:hypothetical protein
MGVLLFDDFGFDAAGSVRLQGNRSMTRQADAAAGLERNARDRHCLT